MFPSPYKYNSISHKIALCCSLLAVKRVHLFGKLKY